MTEQKWASSAQLRSASNRTRYANDLGFPATLIAVTDHVNQAKGDRDPAGWVQDHPWSIPWPARID